MFDIASWHSAMPNITDKDREAVILGYRAGSLSYRTGELPSTAVLARLDEACLLPETHRRLLSNIM